MRLEDILITSRLSAPSRRSPDFQIESEVYRNLARVMKNSPEKMIDALLQAGIELCHAGTAGLSLLETLPEGDVIFRWTNLAGAFSRFVGGSTPRNFSPCGACLDRNSPQLLAWPARYFEYLKDAVDIPIVEALILPIYIGDQSPGTIWILSHDENVHFDSEDVRIMSGLAEFTASSLGMVYALKSESQARDRAEVEISANRSQLESLRGDQKELEELMRSRTLELRELTAQIIFSQDEERRRIARDLHDSTGQKIEVLRMDLAKIQRQVRSLREDAGALSECLTLTSEISNEIRSLSYVLHPPMLDELGLISAIQIYIEGINKRRAMQVMLEVESAPGRLANEVEIALFRVIQAALANVQLHSGSKKATIRIAHGNGKLILEIIDQGRGFAAKTVKKNVSIKSGGVGLLGIRERLQLLGGRLEIETGIEGTILRGVVPMSPSSALPS